MAQTFVPAAIFTRYTMPTHSVHYEDITLSTTMDSVNVRPDKITDRYSF